MATLYAVMARPKHRSADPIEVHLDPELISDVIPDLVPLCDADKTMLVCVTMVSGRTFFLTTDTYGSLMAWGGKNINRFLMPSDTKLNRNFLCQTD